MFEAISLSGVILVIVLLYVFRKPVKQVANDAPEAVSSVMAAAVKGANQLDSIVSANCLENQYDCVKRVTAIEAAMAEAGITDLDISAKYNDLMKRKPAPKKAAA